MKKETLLQKALSEKGKKNLKIMEEDIELALSWANGEISLSQVQKAYGAKAGSSVYAKLAVALKKHLQTKGDKK